MKLGLICDDLIKKEILQTTANSGITFYDNPDLFIVQSGHEKPYLPCIVFESKEIKTLLQIIEKLSHTAQSDKVIGYDDEIMYISNTKDILYFEAKDSSVYYRTSSQELKIREKLFEVEMRLSGDKFIRISRSIIINIDKVSSIAPWFNRRLIIAFDEIDTTVEVSKKYVSDFKRFLGMG